MADEDRAAMLAEAYKRGLLSADMKTSYEEALQRGLLAGGVAKDVKKSAFGYVDDLVRAVASGATFGYADTLAAKMDEVTGRGGSYEENLKKERARNEAAPAAIRIPGEIAGGVAGAVAASPVTGTLGAATGLSRLPGAVKAVMGGAAAGGLYASGEAEPGQRLGAVPGGAVVGALTGGVAAGVGKVAGEVLSPRSSALAQLSRAMTRDDLTPQEVLSRASKVSVDRPGTAALADLGGENVRGLVERVAQTPGAGRSTVIPFLTERQTGQMTRIADDLSGLTGSNRTALQAVTETMSQRAAASQPLYEAAYQAGDREIWSPGLERLTGAPAVQSSMRAAVRVWRDNAIADGFGAMNPGAVVEGGGLLKFTGGQVPVFPNLQFWDYTKRMLDNQVQSAIRSGAGQKVRTLTRLTDQVRQELDRTVPEYAGAREAWGGPTSYLNAVESGRDILSHNVSGEEMRAGFNALSGSEKSAYREGAVSAIIARMANNPAKMADMTNYLRSPAMREKVLAIMPDQQAAAAWQRRLDFEVKSSELVGQAMKGSPTARRLAEMADQGDIIGDLVLGAFKGHPPIGLMGKIVVGGAKTIRDTLKSRSDQELARLLTGKGAPARQASPQMQQLGKSALLPSVVGTDSALIQQ